MSFGPAFGQRAQTPAAFGRRMTSHSVGDPRASTPAAGFGRVAASRPAFSKIADWYTVGQQVHTSQVTGTEIVIALHKPTDEVVAMKAAERSRLSRNYAQSIGLYSKLHHPHICELLEVFDSSRVVQVMEAIDGIHLTTFMGKHGITTSESQQVCPQDGMCRHDMELTDECRRAGHAPACERRRAHAQQWRVPP